MAAYHSLNLLIKNALDNFNYYNVCVKLAAFALSTYLLPQLCICSSYLIPGNVVTKLTQVLSSFLLEILCKMIND